MWFTGKHNLHSGSWQNWRHFTGDGETVSCHVPAVTPIKEQVCSSLAHESPFSETGARIELPNWQINLKKCSSGEHLLPSSTCKGWCSSSPTYTFFTILTVIIVMEKPFNNYHILKKKTFRDQISWCNSKQLRGMTDYFWPKASNSANCVENNEIVLLRG